MPRTHNGAETRAKLLDAARDVIRAKGYSATTVDDICAAAGVTKGGFFHHFENKEGLGVAAIERFEEKASAMFAAAPYHAHQDPRARLIGYVDFRASLLHGDVAQYTCLMGTIVQEAYATHPNLRAACDAGTWDHIAQLTGDIEAAKQLYAREAPWSAASVGYFMQSTLQGAFIFAKVKQNSAVGLETLAHLRRYLEMLFPLPSNEEA